MNHTYIFRIMRFLSLVLIYIITTFHWGCAQQDANKNNTPSSEIRTPYAPYGGVFTPKGTLRVLLVFVTYKDGSEANPSFNNKSNNLPDWDYSKNNRLPSFVNKETGACPSYIFNKESDFETEMEAVSNNFSKEFALMSGGEFKMIGEVFTDPEGKPTVVEIDPTGGYSWTNMNGRAVEEMNKINPKFDVSRFDQRQNLPNYKFDNSDTTKYKADKIIDFVVFVHRYNKSWRQQPKPGMQAWTGSGGGFAATGVMPRTKLNGYRIAEGFTMTYRSGVFIHEVAHVLFNAPHIMGVNNVIGDYFYLLSAGWGIMSPNSIFSGFNAWERWYVGFSELVADIKNEEDLKDQNTFILRDFFTTGDAMRVEIPFAGGQRIWIENHARIHPLDNHPWAGNILGKGDTISDTAPGLYVYVEAIEASRHGIFSALSNRANGIKILHAGGNYDYHLYTDKKAVKNNWGNKMEHFKRMEANPISGLNNLYRFPFDNNKDGVISLDKNYNSSKTEWSAPIFREEISPGTFVNTYASFGVYNASKNAGYQGPAAFQDGDHLDMSSNPLPLNYPRYDVQKKALNPFVLNGLGLKFSKIEGSKDMKVEVRFKRTTLCENRRWTGNIVLPDITGDEQADLKIANCTQLILDRGATTNTHTITEQGDFVLPTVFTIKKGATLRLGEKATLLIKDDSKLILEEGAQLILDKRAQIIIKASAELVLNGNSIQKHNSAKVIKQGK